MPAVAGGPNQLQCPVAGGFFPFYPGLLSMILLAELHLPPLKCNCLFSKSV